MLLLNSWRVLPLPLPPKCPVCLQGVCHYSALFVFWIWKKLIKRVCLGWSAMFSLWFANWPEYFFIVQLSYSFEHLVKLMSFFISLCLCLCLSIPLLCLFSFCLICFKQMFWEFYCRGNHWEFPVMEFFEVFAFLGLCIL